MEWIFAVLLVALAIFMWRDAVFKRPKDEDHPGEFGADNSDSGSSDPFFERIARMREQADREVNKAGAQYQRELEARFSEDLKLKHELSIAARANELDRALVDLWEEIRRYPDSSANDGEANLLRVTGVVRTDDDDTKGIEYVANGHTYRITERRWTGMMEGDSYADLRMLEDGAEVFAINCEVAFGSYSYVDSYNCVSVDAVVRGGTWATELVEKHAIIKLEQAKARADLDFFGADEISTRFKK